MKLFMSIDQITRGHVIANCLEGRCTVQQAALRLNLSRRRVQQLKKAFKEKGLAAMLHGNSQRPSAKKTSKEIEQRLLALRSDPALSKSNFLHFHEIVTGEYQLQLSYSTLRRILLSHGIYSPKKRRTRKKVHKTRNRRACFGELLQVDATPFPWFGGKEKSALHAFIDDARGMITGLYLCKNECLLGYLEVLRQTLENYGLPAALYPDKCSVFFVNAKKQLSIEEQLQGTKEQVTQFGKIIKYLGIDMFPAHSSQAKGRVERLWQTLQSRLPVEFARRHITTIEQANQFLKEYIGIFNKQFGVSACDSYSMFVPTPKTLDLDKLLSSVITRKLSSGSTISIKNHLFKIEQNKFGAGTTVNVLISQKHGIRALIHDEFYPIVPLDDIYRTDTVGRTGDLPQVVIDLIYEFLLKDAKAG
ncbi:ISNCY family transposase [Treponema phagedenis]|uniref:ISNCY family transposase n=1 Tax=Treponema phagedenis TaxID=162 RepID=UPI0011EFC260|nr:ISNCY family transposase [Treponema phagedenis]TYT76539.1 ISNCY family transposase [Treponema phagedenis]TYT77723.1 ISNCY family transposase [Treponema phagedenis]